MTTSDISQSSLLTAINMKPDHQIIAIRENGLADANFILAYLMKQILNKEENKICLFIPHNSIGHYHNLGKKIDYDLMKKIKSGDVIPVEPQKCIVNSLNGCSDIDYISSDKEQLVKKLFLQIKSCVEKLLEIQNTNKVYLIIDDISHLADLGIDAKFILTFINCCINIGTTNVSLIVNCHVDTENDEIISNALGYVADLYITVSPLKTGFSHDVGGVIDIKNCKETTNGLRKYHYKINGNEVKAFSVGGVLHN